METSRYLQCLAVDEARLRELGHRDLTVAVPTCPEWVVRDLMEHVALVYLHKVECMRTGKEAEWPPERPEQDAPLALLDRAYAALTSEFMLRPPSSTSHTWYRPDQTVGFWIRRMAQETVIHRVDAELALGEPIAPVPDDLALDGIDEVLRVFLAYGTVEWNGAFGPELTEADDAAVLVSAGGRGWLVRMKPSGVLIEQVAPDAEAECRVSGDPQSVLLWLWRRTDASAVTYQGDAQTLGRLRDLLAAVTQ